MTDKNDLVTMKEATPGEPSEKIPPPPTGKRFGVWFADTEHPAYDDEPVLWMEIAGDEDLPGETIAVVISNSWRHYQVERLDKDMNPDVLVTIEVQEDELWWNGIEAAFAFLPPLAKRYRDDFLTAAAWLAQETF